MEVLAFTLFHILYVTFASQSRVPPVSSLHVSFSSLICFSLLASPPPSVSLSVFEGEVSCVESGSRQSSKHFRPVGGSGGQQGLHTGSDVLQVSTAHPFSAVTVSRSSSVSSAAPHRHRNRQRSSQSHGVGLAGRVGSLTHRHATRRRRGVLAQ